jgi:hypothetical protein
MVREKFIVPYIVYPVYSLAGTVLDQVFSINDLGVIMDEKMNFSEHVGVIR